MSINQFRKKINIPGSADSLPVETISLDKDGQVVRFPLFKKLFLSLAIILVASLSFGLGRLSVVGNREPVKIEYDPQQIILDQEIQAAAVIKAATGSENSSSYTQNSTVVVSKNGERYHYLHCSGAKQIKEENKIVFVSPAVAEAAGYTLAANCKPR